MSTTINTKLTDEMVEKLRKGVVPLQFCNLYHQVCGAEQPAPYSPEAIEALVESVPAERVPAREFCVAQHQSEFCRALSPRGSYEPRYGVIIRQS